MRRITLTVLAFAMAASLGWAQQTGVFSRTDEGCDENEPQLRALTARIESRGHTSAETICYLDEDGSASFTPANDTLVGVSHDNVITGCNACAGF